MRSREPDDRVSDTAPRRATRSAAGNGRSRANSTPYAIPIYIWLLGLVVVLLVMAVAGLWALYLLRGQWAQTGPTPTPIIWTPTSQPEAPPTLTPTAEPAPTEDVAPTVSPDIAIGGYVQVSGTAGSGLNLRQGPGANYPRKDVALDGEIFIVTAGPTEAADVQWWKIRDPNDPERDWWAAANFLEPIPPP